jgi:hypothetical protein
MAKTIYQYAGFTATDLKNRGSATCDMVVNGTGVDCTNITDTRVKNVLGESTTAVSGLCSSSLVNKWSGFAPTEWYFSGDNFLNRVKTPYSMGNFAGYNHNAVAAGWMSGYVTSFKYVGTDTSKILSGALQGGEIDFANVVNATHVKWVVKDSLNNVIGSNVVALGSYYNSNPIIPTCTLSFSGWTGTKTLTSTLYLSNVGGSEFAVYPNTVSGWTITASQRVEPTANVTLIVGDTLIRAAGGTATINRSRNYTVSIASILNNSYTNYTGTFTLKCLLYDETGALVTTETIATNTTTRTFSGTLTHSVDYDYLALFQIQH